MTSVALISSFFILTIWGATAYDWNSLNLPEEHIAYYFTNNPHLGSLCKEEPDCPYKEHVDRKKCWGYEDNCEPENRMYTPQCPGNDGGWTRGGTKKDQIDMFWAEGDFGFVWDRKNNFVPICKPQKKGDSSLYCTDYTRYCKAENIFLNFHNLMDGNDRERYREDVFQKGDIGGKCEMDTKLLESLGEHKSPLQSWYAELQNFSSLDFNPMKTKKKCDIVLEKPTIFMKLDAGVNMFHHFCDFVNLYSSQHFNNSFTTDVNIVMWDTSHMNYGDLFHDTWQAFSDHPIIHLRDYRGKKVCVKDAMFPLLPRMRRGMYYNMPLIPNCQNSSLFRAFSQHILHRMHIPQNGPLKTKLRLTLQERKTKYRRILNQDEIIAELKKNPDYEVQVVNYQHSLPLTEQLTITHNTDMFLGMHGAGLTHLLFLPDWATVTEVYNCDDEHCYKDLARLRGVQYYTWTDMDKLIQEDEGHHPQLGAHKKFTNYTFDVKTFVELVAKAAKNVRESPWFQKAWHEKWGIVKDEF